MSHRQISRNPDLKRLRDEGYDLSIDHAHLVIRDVPYVNAAGEVARGILVSVWATEGEYSQNPVQDHTVYFAGDHPRHKDGTIITAIQHSSEEKEIVPGLKVQHYFSNKPTQQYRDYYEKMVRYIDIISHPARALDPNATAQTHPPFATVEGESVFQYEDTASSRAGISALSARFEGQRVAIIGLGGTGAYVLDLVAKSPVEEIHLFDGDRFSSHNAFRSPSAAALSDLNSRPQKAEYLASLYSRIHRHVIPHDTYLGATNLHLLDALDFVFVCIDRNSPKAVILPYLEARGIDFIDVGMGIQRDSNNTLGGVLRTTTSTKQKRDHLRTRDRVVFTDTDLDAEYDRNIQVADLNALNAALAVIRWKKLLGFYRDLEQEHHSTYTIDGNALLNEDAP